MKNVSLSQNSSDGYVHFKLGRASRDNRDYDSALKELNQALELGLDNHEVRLEIGRTYREKGDFDSAIRELKQALESGLDNDEVHLKEEILLELGRTYREKGEYTEAMEELKSASEHCSSDGRIYLELGRVYQQEENHDSAIRELKRALELGLDNDEVHLELARAYRDKRKYPEAIQEFKAALRHKPSDARLHLELGWIYNDNEDYDSAVKELEQARLLGIDDDELHISLGRMYRKAGEYELSAEEFRRAIEKSPHKDSVFFNNKMLNEVEISQRKIVLKSKPIGLGITLTTRCNLRCKMCGAWKEYRELPKNIINEVIRLLPYLERIVWQGGEVFLLDYFDELFERAASYPNLKQTIVTNGLLINEKRAEKLARENVTITFSIHAVTKDVYEYIISGGAKFEDLLRNIDLINKYREKHDCHRDPFNKMTTIFNAVVMESNYRQLEQFADFAREYKFDEVQFVPIVNIVGSENIFFNQDCKAGEYIAETLPGVSKKLQRYGIVLHSWLPPIKGIKNISRAESQTEDPVTHNCSYKKNEEAICYLPWQQMFMTPEFRLKPGCYCGKEIGDINKSSLEEIWNGEAMQLYRRKLLANDYHDLCDVKCISGVIPKKELKVSRYD